MCLRGVSEYMLCEFDLDGRNHSKTFSVDRKSHGAFVREKNLDQNFDLTQKLEQFSERKNVDFVKDSYVK